MIFLTGGSGLVGSLLTLRALRAGRRVRLLIRPSRDRSPAERFAAAAACFEPCRERLDAWRAQLEFCAGDISEPYFGLGPRGWRDATKGVDEVFHAAAMIDFAPPSPATADAVNIAGAAHVVQFAADAGARLFHLSTAYVAGHHPGPVSEAELPAAGPFRNHYERSKCLGEAAVRRRGRELGVPTVVFRPAILCGADRDGHTFRFNAVYAYMRALCIVRGRLANGTTTPASEQLRQWRTRPRSFRLRLPGTDSVTKNLVPVDYAVQTMWRISRRDDTCGTTFHVSNPAPPTNEDLRRRLSRLLGLDGLTWVAPETFAAAKLNTYESALDAGTRPYRPYMLHEPVFDRTNTNTACPAYDRDFPVLDDAYFERLLTFAIDSRWGRTVPRHVAPRAPVRSDADHARAYFEHFLPRWFERCLVPGLRELDATFRIRVGAAPPQQWSLRIAHGALVALSRNDMKTDCGYDVEPAAFRRITEGRLPPQQAFFQRQVEIDGDIEKALRVAGALAEFFQRYPFVPDTPCN